MICSRCNLDQPRGEFGPSADMWPKRRQCHTCSAELSQRKRHGVTQAERAQIASLQGGCRICKRTDPGGKGWVVDHNRSHCATDKSCAECRRGVLCQWCNSALGYAFDNPEILAAAIEYLSQPIGCAWHMPVACAPSICNVGHARTDGTDGQDVDPWLPTVDISRFVTRTMQAGIFAAIESAS